MKITKITKELLHFVTNEKVTIITKDRNRQMRKSFGTITTVLIASMLIVVERVFTEVALTISMEACPVQGEAWCLGY